MLLWSKIRVHKPVMELAIDINLSLSNVSRKIRNRMSDVVIGHRQDRDLCDGSCPALHSAGPLVNGGEISVHVTRETCEKEHMDVSCKQKQRKTLFLTSPAGYFFPGSGNLTQCLSI